MNSNFFIYLVYINSLKSFAVAVANDYYSKKQNDYHHNNMYLDPLL